MFTERNQLNIISLTLQQTGTFESMYARSYTVDTSPTTLSCLQSRIEQADSLEPGGTVHSTTVAGVVADGASTVIRPEANTNLVANIPNGWGEARFRFQLEVEEVSPMGSYIYRFSGFSEYFDASHGGLVDPDMTFFINDFIRLNRVTNKGTGTVVDRVTESYLIGNGNLIRGNQDDLWGMRQQDIFKGIGMQHMESAMSEKIVDPRIRLGREVFATSRISAVPSHYLANALTAYRHAQITADGGFGPQNVYERAVVSTQERMPFENAFIRELTTSRGMNFAVSDFTINQLAVIDPNVVRVVNFAPLTDEGELSQTGAGYAYWNGADHEAIVADQIATAVPALMIECGLVTLFMTSSNLTMNSQVDSRMTIPGQTVATTDPRQNYNYFIKRFNEEVFPDISLMNQIGLSIELQADVAGEITIWISINGGEEAVYKYPCFADSLLQHTVTGNEQNFVNLVTGLDHIAQQCGIEAPKISTNLGDLNLYNV